MLQHGVTNPYYKSGGNSGVAYTSGSMMTWQAIKTEGGVAAHQPKTQ